VDPDFLAQNPVATPDQTTTYQVEVSDFFQTATASVTVTVNLPLPSDQVDLAVTVVDTPDPVGFNQLLTYIATVTNNGPATATNVVVTLTPPSQIESDSPMPSTGTCQRISSTRIECAIGTLVSGSTATVSLRGFPFQPGTLSFTAAARSSQIDSNLTNNSTTQMTTVLPAPN
jgi:uncharacterized repeat protein (TIGR01451 family)